jgi:hypothetical protein
MEKDYTEQERTELGWNTWVSASGQWQKTEAGGRSVSGPYGQMIQTKKINAWIDIYFLTYFHCKLYK